MLVMFCNNVGFIRGCQEVVYLSITDNAKEKETRPDEPLVSNTNLKCPSPKILYFPI